MSASTPADIARETLRLLAQRRLPPTPENYQALYEEVAGLLPQEGFPQRHLQRIASVLPSQTPAQTHLSQLFHQAVNEQDWAGLQAAIVGYARLDFAPAAAQPALTAPLSETVPIDVLPPELAEQMARLIENTVSALGEEDERLRELSLQLVNFLRVAPPPIASLTQMLHNYSYRLSFNAQEQGQRRERIQEQLSLTLDHLRSMGAHDEPLQQQAEQLGAAMEKPWSLSQLDTIEHHLKSLLFRHLELHQSQQEAHTRLKDLLANYASHMADMCEHSSRHQAKLTECAGQIQQARSLGELPALVEAMVESGHTLVTENRHVHAQLQDLRAQADAQENTIHALTTSLQRMQDTSRHDPFSGALNSQGLKETLLSESARARRHGTPLSVALLQLDLPDALRSALGAEAEDLVLRHLTHVARSVMRPQDALARMPDDSLVMLLPESPVANAAQALSRLQTELTQRPLIHGDNLERLHFSGGVVQMLERETPLDLLQRAAHAAQQAQLMGGARVVIA